MGREWPLADVPLLLEVAGRNTAEDASRSLPIVLALGMGRAGQRRDLGVAPARSVLLRPLSRLWAGAPPPGPRAPAARLGAPARRGAGRPCRYGPPRRAAMDAVRLPEGP
jgi:hypothetical protein